MTNPDQIKVYAHIPNIGGDKYVVNEQGDRPSLPYIPEAHRTYEGTLDAIVSGVVGSHGKIDRRLPDAEQEPHHIVYQTRPVGETAIKAADHTWNTLD